MNDYIVVTDQNEWIASYSNISEDRMLDQLHELSNRHFDKQIYCYKINSVIEPEITFQT